MTRGALIMSMRADNDTIRDVYVVGLRNAHALEKEATQLIERQLERLDDYPEVRQRLRQHLEETHAQHKRLDEILDRLGEERSTLKDVAMSFMGNMAAMAHVPADDEILKNTFANLAFENYEVAAYRSLITLAEAVGDQQAVPLLRQTLEEERNMAAWIDEHVPEITHAYLSREAAA
jgi:ferritin-like metal-binding protein YciE